VERHAHPRGADPSLADGMRIKVQLMKLIHDGLFRAGTECKALIEDISQMFDFPLDLLNHGLHVITQPAYSDEGNYCSELIVIRIPGSA